MKPSTQTHRNPLCPIHTGQLCLTLDQTSQQPHWHLRDSRTQSLLMRIENLSILTPQVDGHLNPSINGEMLNVGEDGWRLRFDQQDWGYHEISIQPVPAEDALDITMHLHPSRDGQLEALHCFGPNTAMNFHQLINYRNRHHTAEVWPELLLGDKQCQTDTTSRDWQFAPHPTLFHFKRDDMYLSWGTMQLPIGTFGMHISLKKYVVQQWYIDYGGIGHGQELKAGQCFTSPTFRLRFSQQPDPYAAYADWGRMLVQAGKIPDPSERAQTQQAWWLAPLYCTWIDQCFLASYKPAEELQEQANTANHMTRRVLNTEMVRQAVAVIRKNNLPIKTILLDEGWHRGRGIWEPHPDRFADLRSLVDELHEQGLKVVVWWAWPEIEKYAEMEINPKWLMGQGKRNRHGCLMYDFSNPSVQHQFLKPLFHKLFSDAPGCCNLDGIKTDFQADKIHADMPLIDDSWRGEENYLYRMHELFYTTLKSIKPDAVHIGCAGHYWLAKFIDINRTYDVHSSNVVEHENRARMLLSTTTQCPVAYDFHNFLDFFEEYFDSADRLGCSVQIGNVLTCQRDPLSQAQQADESYWRILAEKLHA